MPTCIAFYRGINVGGRHKLPMKELVSALEASGASDTRTYIQSGNAAYRGLSEHAVESTGLIERRFGFRPDVIVLGIEELERVIRDNPFPGAEGKACHVYFCNEAPTAVDEARIEQLRKDSELFALVDKVFYLYAPDGIGRSKLAAQVERCLQVAGTARNLNTVNKTLDLARNLAGG